MVYSFHLETVGYLFYLYHIYDIAVPESYQARICLLCRVRSDELSHG